MRIKSFDSLRAYGALGVLFAHLPRLGDTAFARHFDNSLAQFSIGYILLDMFFVMSGYLITSIILKAKEKGTFSFREFYVNRTLRIFPIYYLTILLVAIFITTQGLWYPLFYVANYYFALNVHVHPLNHSWSLAVEEHFYLLWPLILTQFSNSTCKKILLIGVPAITLLTVLIVPHVLPYSNAYEFIILGTTTRWFSISLGSYLAFNNEWLNNLSRKKVLTIFSITAIVYIIFYLMPVIPFLQDVPKYAKKVLIVPFISLGVIILWYRLDYARETLFKKLIVNKVADYIGKMSYGIYLYHYPILYYFNMVDWQNPITHNAPKYWAMIGLILACASLSYHFIELPLLNMRHRFYKKK
ncbi:MAG TPA: acyltransferase [Bacteroidia bacterium]|nr:acyltransferase [Bacteroidia bacterium]HNU32627.1 acyltransferase [Bacteroidia bacterium]